MTNPDKLLSELRECSQEAASYRDLEMRSQVLADMERAFDELDAAMREGRYPAQWMRHNVKFDE